MTADPREAVLLEWKWDLGSMEPFDADPPEKVLHDLDAADPLRAMLGEVVEFLELDVDNPFRVGTKSHAEWPGRRSDLLTRLRTLTPTEEGET